MELVRNIPQPFINFLLVGLFSLLIGLEQRRHLSKDGPESLFGTDRAFTLTGILGYILYVISPLNLTLFIGGGIVLSALLGVYYYQKISAQKSFSLTSIITMLVTYCLAPLIFTQPQWLSLLIIASLLIITELKENLVQASAQFDHAEFITLAKFLLLAGVVLPLLPEQPLSATIDVSPYRIWLAVVVVSGISYSSYLIQKFVFPGAGILVTSILGGLYSSTATTLVLARKSREEPSLNISPAILLATTMMFVRILLLAFFFNKEAGWALLPRVAALIVLSLIAAGFFVQFGKAKGQLRGQASLTRNPLEFRTALVFAALFVFFVVAIPYVTRLYGNKGFTILSLLVGFTDVDPFVITLFQNVTMNPAFIAFAVLCATTSNNLLKMIYSLALVGTRVRIELAISFASLIAAGVVVSFFFWQPAT